MQTDAEKLAVAIKALKDIRSRYSKWQAVLFYAQTALDKFDGKGAA